MRVLSIIGLTVWATFWAGSNLWAVQDARDYYIAGVDMMQNDEIDDAIKAFEEAIRLNPRLPILHNVLGMAKLKKAESIHDAIASFKKALELDANFSDAYVNIGTSYATMGGMPELALRNFKKAIELNPKSARGHLGLGWIQLLEEQSPYESAKSFQKAIDLNPGMARAYFGLGYSALSMGKKADALKPISVLRSMSEWDLAGILERMTHDQEAFLEKFNEESEIDEEETTEIL